METFVEALSISVTSLIIAFSVLVLIMLLMYAMAALVNRGKTEEQSAGIGGRQTGAGLPSAAISSESGEQQELAAIMAALQAAGVDIPSGGRVRIEKVSRRG